jgi:phosphate transport system substrate-binding protein
VQGAGYVNQSLTRTPLNLQGDRLSNAIRAAGEDVTLEALQAMVTRLDGAERLSPTFRFADGAAELDTQSRASVTRLAAAIEAGFFDGRTLSVRRVLRQRRFGADQHPACAAPGGNGA